CFIEGSTLTIHLYSSYQLRHVSVSTERQRISALNIITYESEDDLVFDTLIVGSNHFRIHTNTQSTAVTRNHQVTLQNWVSTDYQTWSLTLGTAHGVQSNLVTRIAQHAVGNVTNCVNQGSLYVSSLLVSLDVVQCFSHIECNALEEWLHEPTTRTLNFRNWLTSFQ